jgi:hypothetical protein
MSEKQEILTLTLKGKEVKLHLVESTTRIGIQRSLAIFRALEEHEKNPDEDEIEFTVKRRIFPDCLYGTETAEGMEWPFTLEKIMALPEEFVDDWLTGVYKVNPHWNAVRGEADVKKKESVS